MNISNIELIHLITSYPLLYKNLLPPYEKLDFDNINNFIDCLTDGEKLYLKYCLNAYDPSKRDYDLLREFLYLNVQNNKSVLSKLLFSLLPKDENGRLSIITDIYDIGGGHDGWADILQEYYPNATIYMVDKDLIKTKYTQIHTNVFETLNTFTGHPQKLIFMSEFIHCKKDNWKILKDRPIRACHVIVNEIMENAFIDYRLRLTGGGLVSLDFLEKKVPPLNYKVYSNVFSYYLAYWSPNG